MGKERLATLFFIKGNASIWGVVQQRLHGIGREEKSVAWNQEDSLIKGIEQPKNKLMKALNTWRIDQHFAAKKASSLFLPTQHNGSFKTCLLHTPLKTINSTKHACFVLFHALARSSCENDGDGHAGHLNAFFQVHRGQLPARTTSLGHGGARPSAHDLTLLQVTTQGGAERPLHHAPRSI